MITGNGRRQKELSAGCPLAGATVFMILSGAVLTAAGEVLFPHNPQKLSAEQTVSLMNISKGETLNILQVKGSHLQVSPFACLQINVDKQNNCTSGGYFRQQQGW